MAKLYYGNSNVSIEGSNIRGVEIRFRGAISITDKTSESFAISHQNNGIMVFPIGEGFLNDLFDYIGELKIISVIVADNNAEKVPTTIHRVMDYSELLASNSEDMATNSEDLSSGYVSGKIQKNTNLNKKIISNLNTSDWDMQLYLESGESYRGSFHIHIQNSSAMTGGIHTEDSQSLYYKKTDDEKLTPTTNPDNVVRGKKRPTISKSRIKRKIRTTSSGGY